MEKNESILDIIGEAITNDFQEKFLRILHYLTGYHIL